MDLTTRCPRCGTVFEASLQDLQLRKGYIRCVQCAHIFDGYAEVVSDSAGEAPGASDSDAPRAEPVFLDHSASDESAPRVFRPGREEPRFTFGDRDEDAEWSPAAGREQAGSERSFVVEAHPTRGEPYGGSAGPLLRQDEAGVFQRLGRLLLNLLVVLGVLLALTQLAFIYRAQIALSVPSLRPVLERACGPLNCEVPYARDLSQVVITGSDLKRDTASELSAQAGQPTAQHFILSLTLRNQGVQPSMWPTVVLDLNDSSGARVVRRNLEPRDYLSPARLNQPFPAGSEVMVQLPLTVDEVRIIGFELSLFFS